MQILTATGYVLGYNERVQKALLEEDDDEHQEQLRLNENDPNLRGIIPEIDEMEFHEVKSQKAISLAEKILKAGALTSEQVVRAANVAVETPQLLLELYAGAAHPEITSDKIGQLLDRMEMYSQLWDIYSTMVENNGPSKIDGLLLLRRVDSDPANPTLRGAIARLARKEAAHRGLGHWTATKMLALLGYYDVYETYLD